MPMITDISLYLKVIISTLILDFILMKPLTKSGITCNIILGY